MRRIAVLTITALVVPAGAFALGRRSITRSARQTPIRLEHGIPVGVLDTPNGAVAAADNYLAAEDQSLTSASAVRQVIAALWAPAAGSGELAQPLPAAALLGRPATFAGLRLTAAVAADRLDSYTGGSARVEVWHELTVWSPTIEPTQRWLLDTVWLHWSSGQWLITSRSSAPDAETPVPAWTSGGAQDRTTTAFGSRLSGMSAPYYDGGGS